MKLLRILMLVGVSTAIFSGCFATKMPSNRIRIVNSTGHTINLRVVTENQVGVLDSAQLVAGERYEYPLETYSSVKFSISRDPGNLKILYHPQYITFDHPGYYNLIKNDQGDYAIVEKCCKK